MPLFVIHALDRPGHAAVRAAHYDAHRAYLAAAGGVVIHASGPLMSDDGAAMIGSHFVIECADADTARRFNAGDPFARADLWSEISVRRFDLRRGSVGER